MIGPREFAVRTVTIVISNVLMNFEIADADFNCDAQCNDYIPIGDVFDERDQNLRSPSGKLLQSSQMRRSHKLAHHKPSIGRHHASPPRLLFDGRALGTRATTRPPAAPPRPASCTTVLDSTADTLLDLALHTRARHVSASGHRLPSMSHVLCCRLPMFRSPPT